MSSPKPIHIQVRDVYHNLIKNATIKVIERKSGKILYNEKSLNGEAILDDIESLKNCHAFRVEIDHPHYKSNTKTDAPCIRLANLDKPHTLEFPYQDKLLVSSVYGEIREIESRDDKVLQQEKCLNNNTDTLCLPTRTYNVDTKILKDTQAQSIIQNTSIHLKAYYNQDSIPNKDKHSKAQKQKYQDQKTQTKWGYILFDKEIDIDSKLKELTKDSTIPLTELKEFHRIYKEDSITFYNNQANTPNNTSNANTESKSYLLGKEVELYFKEEWQNKQIRFFAYMNGAKSDVGGGM
ncbi:hypothetical protein [Campylobacter sp. MIT 99-7217]|uniref:hypothetical protein n=1 Tax=Campylobacter sp. MIT 99-7217 TaxID=535091 RepID=UPI0021AEAA4B|nr:hypothetical protein [Campylobacter sp. MIT 99-7217]